MKILPLVSSALARIWARLDLDSEAGASAVEYGLMIFLIAATIIVAVVFLGHTTSNSFSCSAHVIQTNSGC